MQLKRIISSSKLIRDYIRWGRIPQMNDESKIGKLLVVEDEVTLCKLLEEEFSEFFDVRLAYDGEAGLAAAIEFIPDCIITDIRMPRMSGLSLLKRVRTIPELAFTGVILLTQLREEQDRVRGYEHFADLYIPKPFSMAELKVATMGLVKMRQHLRSMAQPVIPLEHHGKGIAEQDLHFLRKLSDVIEDHIDSYDLSISYLAEQCRIEPDLLEERLLELEGVSPARFVRQIRLEQSLKLLSAGVVDSIESLAARVGFKDAVYFESLFKDHFGFAAEDRLK